MSGLSQETRSPTSSTPTKDTGASGNDKSVADSNSDRSAALESGGADSGAMAEYLAMPSTTRGGFTARAMQAAGQNGDPAALLSSGKPKDPITRASAAVIISRVTGFGEVLEGQPPVFTDLPLSHWAAPAVYRCREEGIFSGFSDNTFRPTDTLSAGAATVLAERISTPGSRVKFDREASLQQAEKTRGVGGQGGQGDLSNHDRTFTDELYKKHQKTIGQADVDLSYANHKGEMALFEKSWTKNKARYEAVAAKSGVPAELIAALHWRESSGNFNTYLHQGDPLGKPAVNWPNNIPVFHKWEDAAVHALNMKGKIAKDLGMTSNTNDLAAMATYAEYYNGLGYHNKGKPSPYVYSGTDQYSKGKYVRDGVYDPNTKDRQLGVMAMVKSISSGSGAGTAKGTLLEGQLKKGNEPVASLKVTVVDAKGQNYEGVSNANGFFSFSSSLAAGTAKVTAGGSTVQVKVSEGSPAWASLDVKDPQSSAGGQDSPTTDKPKTDTGTSAPASSGPKELTHTVKAGDTLYELAQKYLGDGNRYMEIFNLNKDKLKSPSALSVGQVLKIPSKSTSSGAGTGSPQPTTQTLSHTVRSGDTLSGIASKYYGDSGRWSEIFAANRDKLSNANALSIGQVLKIPNVKVNGSTGSTSTGSTGTGTTQKPTTGTGTTQKPTTGTTQKPTTGSQGLVATRGEAAAKSAHISYVEGRKTHGDGSWETQGSNQGPWVNQFKSANNAGGKNEYEWCGMFVGYHYSKVGIRKEILKNLVFWSGYRLNQFFSGGKYVGGAGKAGSWWQPHKTKQLGTATGSKRKEMLKEFGPQAGDIVLFRSDYSHVAMVTDYDESTGTLEIMEGNRGNKVQATAYGTGDNQITFIGRFNESDFEPGGGIDAALEKATEPAVSHKNAGAGSTR